MMRPPPISQVYLYPVTGGTALLSVAVSALWWQGKDMSFLFSNFMVSEGEIYRLLTTTLPHINVLHLAFNICCLWTFGTRIESVYGHFWTLAIYCFLAATSSAADYALASSGVGLSGVGYGLFGMLWILNGRDPRFEQSLDRQTILLFVGWFFFCIFTTKTNLMKVANVAHGAGAVGGVLLGECLISQGLRKTLSYSATTVFGIGCLAGALIFRPYVNLEADIASEQSYLGFLALEQNRNGEALIHLWRSIDLSKSKSSTWYNIGIAYMRLDEFVNALPAFEQAVLLNPHSTEFTKARDACKERLDGDNFMKKTLDQMKKDLEGIKRSRSELPTETRQQKDG